MQKNYQKIPQNRDFHKKSAKMAISGDKLLFFEKEYKKYQQNYKIILENRIFHFWYRHISHFGGSFYKFMGFYGIFLDHFFKKNE